MDTSGKVKAYESIGSIAEIQKAIDMVLLSIKILPEEFENQKFDFSSFLLDIEEFNRNMSDIRAEDALLEKYEKIGTPEKMNNVFDRVVELGRFIGSNKTFRSILRNHAFSLEKKTATDII